MVRFFSYLLKKKKNDQSIGRSMGSRTRARIHALALRHWEEPQLYCTVQAPKMELREPFIEDEAEPFREAELLREVEICSHSGFSRSVRAKLTKLQVSSWQPGNNI